MNPVAVLLGDDQNHRPDLEFEDDARRHGPEDSRKSGPVRSRPRGHVPSGSATGRSRSRRAASSSGRRARCAWRYSRSGGLRTGTWCPHPANRCAPNASAVTPEGSRRPGPGLGRDPSRCRAGRVWHGDPHEPRRRLLAVCWAERLRGQRVLRAGDLPAERGDVIEHVAQTRRLVVGLGDQEIATELSWAIPVAVARDTEQNRVTLHAHSPTSDIASPPVCRPGDLTVVHRAAGRLRRMLGRPHRPRRADRGLLLRR